MIASRTRWIVYSEPWRDSVDLFLVIDSDRPHAAVGVDQGGVVQWQEIRQGDRPPVFLRLDPRSLEELAKTLSGYTQSSDATLDALKDARTVRDRLLTLVERTT